MRLGNASSHDLNPKTLLDHGDPNCALPGGEDAAQEVGEAIACIMSSPYVAPYISKNLIQHLVTSNPNPLYVGRASSAFRTGSFPTPASAKPFASTVPAALQAMNAAMRHEPETHGAVS